MDTHTRARRWTLALVAALLAAPVVAAADAPTQIEVRLYEAVWGKSNQQVKDGPMLLLMVVRDGDHWDRVVGTAGSLNTCLDVGLVSQGTLSDQALELVLSMEIYGDVYVPGGRGEYKVSLKAQGGGGFEGAYEGTFRGVPAKGKADARVLPPAPQFSTYPAAIQPGEHPRILFRKSDLEALKKKAETPLGQAMLVKADDDIGLALRYQLTGDKKYADQARESVEKLLDCNFGSARTPGSHHGIFHYGWVWEHPAVCYDLCYDAWDAAFKKKVERYCMLWAERILWQRGMFNTQGGYIYGHGEAGTMYYGVALGALALYGEKGPEPAKPVALDHATSIAPAADYKPGKDVPVLPLEVGKSPTSWLASKPLRAWIFSDPLQELGGVEKCRPEAGTTFTFDHEKVEFQPLAKEFVPPDGGIYLNVAKSVRPGHVKSGAGPELVKDGPLTICLYAVLDNAEPRLVKVNAGFTRWGTQQVVLNGHDLVHGQVVKLEKGLYPLLVVCRVKARWDALNPKLDAATEADVQASQDLLARLQQEQAYALKDYEYDLAAWKRTGGFDQEYQRMFEVTRYLMYLQCREGVGTGGSQSTTSAESYELGLHPAMYATAFRNCFNRDLSPFPDITQALPRRIFTHVYPEKGAPVAQEIHGPTDIGPDYFAFHFPLIQQEWKPGVLWAWRRHCGGKTDTDIETGGKWFAGTRTFVNFPTDIEPKHPSLVLPLTWEAPGFGYYGFRSGWVGKDDFIVQVWLKSDACKGYAMPNAGTFRIMGLGHEWVIGYPTVRLDNKRYFDPVVVLPEDDINDGGEAHATFFKGEKDGSGALTADLNEVYCRKLEYEKYGHTRKESSLVDSGIHGLRAYAVDYSGASGSPCLFVLVDKITGGKSKVWPWYLPGVVMDGETGKVADTGADFKSARIEGNTATITKPDGATMQLTFAGPANPVVKAEVKTLKFQQTYRRGEAAFTAPGLFASGADASDGEFLVVVTIQKGPPPPVKVDGKGLDAKVTVGKRTIRFDGQKILIEAR